MLFYELREADDELGLGITLAHEEHFSPAEFLEAVEAARTRVASAYEEETLIEAIAAELERTHGFTAALDRAIAAAVIGGVSLAGGEGTILGTVIGAFIMSVLINGLRILSVPQEWQITVTGLIVIFAVYADILRRRK